MTDSVDDKIRVVLDAHGGLPAAAGSLDELDDLYVAGMTSNASVNVMLALEDAFGIEFPDTMLKRSVFESIAAIRTAVTELLGARHG